jgi:DNA-binding protein H-NS
MNYNINNHDLYRETNPSRVLNNPLSYVQRQQQQQQQQQQQREASMRSMTIGDMMERARLAASNTANIHQGRPQSPANGQPGVSSHFMDAIQRSDQNALIDRHAKASVADSPSSPLEPIESPSSRSSRPNRPAKFYPRPPLLNTWQGRGAGQDEFAGLMTDREKQWVVKIQLHQASQTQEEVCDSITDKVPRPRSSFVTRIITFTSGLSKSAICSKCMAINRIVLNNAASTSATLCCSC